MQLHLEQKRFTWVTGFSPGRQTTLCSGRLRPTQLTHTNSSSDAYMKHIQTPSHTFIAVRLDTTGNVLLKPFDVVKKFNIVVTPATKAYKYSHLNALSAQNIILGHISFSLSLSLPLSLTPSRYFTYFSLPFFFVFSITFTHFSLLSNTCTRIHTQTVQLASPPIGRHIFFYWIICFYTFMVFDNTYNVRQENMQ